MSSAAAARGPCSSPSRFLGADRLATLRAAAAEQRPASRLRQIVTVPVAPEPVPVDRR